jgi:type I restriction-modification system DNA methylase subunit
VKKPPFSRVMFHGFDFDSTMLRIGSMNILLHGVENPDVRYRNSLVQSAADEASKPHKELRRALVEDHKLDAVVKLPGGVFKPYAGVSTAILPFTKTNSGGTDHVWFYDVAVDGWSLDDKRAPLLAEGKLGPWTSA